jgi:uncharacterized protein YuzE/large-conductance mechanosensitive channel
MDSKKINFFVRIKKSILNFDFYQTIVKESVGNALGYLVLLSLIIGVLSCIKPVYETNKIVGLVINYFESDIPYFEFNNGELQVKGDMPIVFEEGTSIVVVNTEEELEENILDDYQQGVLITKTKIISKDGIEKREYSLKDFGTLSFDKESIQNFLPALKMFLIPFIIIGTIIGMIIGKLFSSLFVSLIGFVVNSIIHGNQKYGEIYKIGIYSLTLPTVIKFIVKLLPFKIPFFFFIYYGIVILYMVKGIHSAKSENKSQLFAANDL